VAQFAAGLYGVLRDVRFLKRFKHKDLIAVAVGAVLAGVPLVMFDFWLNGVVERQGQDEVVIAARRAITLAETRVGRVITALDNLAAHGIDGCRANSLEAMRQAAFAGPIKEIAVVGPDGQTQCTHLGLPLGQRKVLSSEPLAGAQGYSLDVIQIGTRGERIVRIRRASGSHANGVAALIPTDQFLPQVSTEGGLFSAYAKVRTRQGNVIGEAGTLAEDKDGQSASFIARMQSERFGFAVMVAKPRSIDAGKHGDLNKLSLFVPAAIAAILIAFAKLIPKRQSGNPVAELGRALDAGEFIPYYQPIVDIRSGQLQGAEVLVRWRKPDGTLILPGSFIPLAESGGLIHDMTMDLMRRVCVEAGAAIGRRPGLKIGFNFTAQLFTNESIIKQVRDIFAPSPIALSQVVLELTERDPIENLTETRQIIAALQGMGVRIAIDDVGTGHSGLSYMLKLGVDIIKIDKMFVDAIGSDRNSTTIVETLVDLAHNMRMDIIAEGVENFEQVVHLRELGIRQAQGYVFAPPLPGSAFLQLVEAIDPLPAAAADQEAAGAAGRYMSARKRFSAAG
jgi:sensor c-di-GMP phosphodiesterase-like protein